MGVTKGKGSFLKDREMLMVHALNTREVDLADNHLGVAVSESKDGEWYPSQETRIAFLKYFEDKKDIDVADKFCKTLKLQRLKEEHIEISPELENLLQKVSASELTA